MGLRYTSKNYTKTFSSRDDLKKSLDVWSSEKKFELVFTTQERTNENGVKVSTLKCKRKNKDQCSFMLEFRTDPESNKPNNYILYDYKNIHNHQLNTYHGITALTEDVKEKIRQNKAQTRTYQDLTSLINKQCKTNFFWRTIYYEVKKMEDKEIGTVTNDANNLVKLLKADALKRCGFYETKIANGKLDSICFMSKRMKKVLNSFKDVLIIDTSHKVNRFNMPILDVAVVNNLGKTVCCFFALLPNHKYESFFWALNHLKLQITGTPGVIFSDEEEALTKGI